MEQIKRAADSLNIRYDEFDDKELCLAANVLYSDFCEAFRSFIPPDREALAYARAAHAFLDDDDGPSGSEKLALYYKCIANND